jgi:hypothetical protein
MLCPYSRLKMPCLLFTLRVFLCRHPRRQHSGRGSHIRILLQGEWHRIDASPACKSSHPETSPHNSMFTDRVFVT